MQKAIMAARIHSGDIATRYITLSTATASACVTAADTIDISSRTDAPGCWTAYDSALDKISIASGINIRNLIDPWGRPYHLDENEKEGAPVCGTGKDNLGVYKIPRVSGNWSMNNVRQIPYITPNC